jgi:putative DNA primase/helicase
MHLANCVLRFDRHGVYEALPFSPAFMSRNASPIAYQQGAQAPEFEEKILAHIDEDDRELIQKIAGQCLLGRNYSQNILLMNGVENSSKTTLIRLIAGLVGERNSCQLRTKFLDARFEVGRFLGKTLLIGADVKANFLSTDGAEGLKSLVGGEILTGEHKISNRLIHLKGEFGVIIGCNSHLIIKLEDDAGPWRRRLLITYFEKSFEGKRIENLHQYLLTREGPGILNWALEGTIALFKDLREDGEIRQSARQRARVRDLLLESDSLGEFLREEVVKEDRCTLAVDEITASYRQYCKKRLWEPLSLKAMQAELKEQMLSLYQAAQSNSIQRDKHAVRGYRNVRFKQGVRFTEAP